MGAQPLQFVDIDHLFSIASEARIRVHHVGDDRFQDASHALQDLIKELGEEASDPFSTWSAELRFLKRLRFVLTTSPLGVGQALDLSGRPPGWPEVSLRRFEATHANVAPFHRETVELLLALPADEPTPLAANLMMMLEDAPADSAVVTKDAAVSLATSDYLTVRDFHHPVVTHRELRTVQTYVLLIVLGPIGWYPEHLRSSPRAPETRVVVHPWIRDDYVVRPLLAELGGTSKRISPPVEVVSRAKEYRSGRDPLDLSQLVPGFTSGQVNDLARKRSRDARRGGDLTVPARPFVLASGQMIFLPADTDSRRMAAYIDEDGQVGISQSSVRDLNTDAFLLVRTSGSGDHVRAVADLALEKDGVNPQSLRADQDVWKRQLLSEVAVDGPSLIARSLVRLGVGVASSSNVRRWCSDENIGLGDDDQFRALLKYLELDERSEQIIRSTRRLRAAHQVAGTRIREQLLEQMESIDAKELDAKGQVRVELAGVDAGSMMLARIEQVGDENVDMPSSELGVLQEIS